MVKTTPLPAATFLYECFLYDPDTGVVLWKHRPRSHFESGRAYSIANTQCAGKPAGTLNSNGYLRVGFGGRGKIRRLYLHQIIYKMMTGDDPPDEIDHWDLDRINNRWDNLRPATTSQNAQNKKLRCTNTTGFKGVWFNRRDDKYEASITVMYKVHRLGRYDTAEAAHAAYQAAAKRLHGDFSNMG